MNCLDLNALYALDAWSLAEMAGVLGRAAHAERYRDQYERMKALVNTRLWNEREGFYFDRFWDGPFSVHKAASAFYTLLARIPDEARAQRMLKRLLDPRQFWGDYVKAGIIHEHVNAVPPLPRSLNHPQDALQGGQVGLHRQALRIASEGLNLPAYGFESVYSTCGQHELCSYLAELARRGLANA